MNLNSKQKEYRWVLILLIIGLGILLGTRLWMYVTGFLGAITIYVIVRKLNKKLIEEKKWKPWLSALFIILLTTLIVFIPLIGFALILVDTVSGIKLDIPELTYKTQELAILVNERLGTDFDVTKMIAALPAKATAMIQPLVTGVYSLVINTFIAVFVLYFMLVSYASLERMIDDILPFDRGNKKILIKEIISIIKAATIGIPLVSMIQGVIAYVGYLAFGVDNPMLLAILVGFTTIIPIVGTGLVWVPVGLTALFDGNIARGLLLLIYGLLVIGGSDTVSRFMLQKKMADIHPLITFFGVFFGIPIFGLLGVIFGPLIISLFFLFINMYRNVYVIGSDTLIGVGVDMEKNDKVIENTITDKE